MNIKEQQRVRQELDVAITSLKLDNRISTDSIISLVYLAGEIWGDKAHLYFQKEIMKKTSSNKDPEKTFQIVELVFQCWNYFPHKDMDERYIESNPEMWS